MRVILTTTLLLIVASFIGLKYAAAQQHKSPSQDTATPDVQVAEGTLTRLDPDLQQLWIQGPGNSERMFAFTDQTEVEGSGNSDQGLSGDSATQLRIYYQNLNGVNTALEIEVLASQPSASVSL